MYLSCCHHIFEVFVCYDGGGLICETAGSKREFIIDLKIVIIKSLKTTQRIHSSLIKNNNIRSSSTLGPSDSTHW